MGTCALHAVVLMVKIAKNSAYSSNNWLIWIGGLLRMAQTNSNHSPKKCFWQQSELTDEWDSFFMPDGSDFRRTVLPSCAAPMNVQEELHDAMRGIDALRTQENTRQHRFVSSVGHPRGASIQTLEVVRRLPLPCLPSEAKPPSARWTCQAVRLFEA